MKIIYPGHRYELANLKSPGTTVLQFYQDAERHPYCPGTSCQEVLRALIDRVTVLHGEKPWWGNVIILKLLRQALVLFEARALLYKVEKDGFPVEDVRVDIDGHFRLERQ